MLYYLDEDKEDIDKGCKRIYMSGIKQPRLKYMIDEEIERVHSFEYLGSLVEADGDSTN